MPSRFKKNNKNLVVLSFIIFIIFTISGCKLLSHQNQSVSTKQDQKNYSSIDTDSKNKIDWKKPSENKPYPIISNYPHLWVKVSTTKHRVYLMNDTTILYTMFCSTGSKGQETPKGNFEIQSERGDNFYNSNSGEGANYWVSFKDHGIYLFHSVPVNRNGNYIISEAEELGKSSNSHGCVRLSVADAQWFYKNIPTGTKVVIE